MNYTIHIKYAWIIRERYLNNEYLPANIKDIELITWK